MLTFSQFGIPFKKVVHGLCGRADQLRDKAVCNEDRALCFTVAGFPEWFFRRNVEPGMARRAILRAASTGQRSGRSVSRA